MFYDLALGSTSIDEMIAVQDVFRPPKNSALLLFHICSDN